MRYTLDPTFRDKSIFALSWIKLNQSHSCFNAYLTAQGGDNYVLNLMVLAKGANKKVRKVEVGCGDRGHAAPKS